MKALAAPLGALLMLVAAGPAQADPADVDTDFLAALQAAGITYKRPDQAIVTAKMVCGLIKEGKPSPEVLDGLKARNPGLTTEHGSIFVGIAAHTYCPDQLVQSDAGSMP
ncbi:DUF732 domain-containing protein [Mycolicibacter senuensis]|uniref:DUF732 domain-containing protein n=1 Tax=Mycolicibacter senuensis TaxID=386913 RepID=A0A7I9XK78_9MYCO|nr:DUF732 domain-containing protein [Mycolicibacter senuensis]MDQ2625914.1 DUF732 domain-containing protein [Actinomycetota bacterium]ORW63671.1 hypothetical protein AWC24_01715 [Mycolicibacter senuensis]GFG70401.1 hypothetical protein MSEN_21210 [Mycolicibacter senuensis]